MVRTFLAAVCVLILAVQTGHAQQSSSGQANVWVQIEAQPNLNAINEGLQRRASELRDVNGFYLGSGWYGIALGPYAPDDAQRILSTLRSQGRIPRDSYIADADDFERQIWPIGEDQLAAAQAVVPADTAEPDPQDDAATTESVAVEPLPEPEEVDETPREARAGESRLNREERAALQVALKWGGHYAGRIDAAFGGGTRRSMAAWQTENGHEPTGVLTTKQRAQLLGQYNAVLDGMGLAMVSDPQMGIEMIVPTGVVQFTKYEPPFAHFEATGDIPASVLMISQEGNQDTLFGLYDIMQTLRIVPLDGPRERDNNSFTLIGESATMISHTEATLKNGQIKGFSLIWPAGDEERRTRILGEMQQSFARIDGVLDPAEGYNDAQSIDLISGLEIRKPVLSRTGFYVDTRGTVITTTEVVQSCGHITIEDEYEAEIAAQNTALGIVVLRPKDALAPMNVANFLEVAPRLKSDVAVAGFSYGGVLGAPSLTYGEVAELRGLNGEEDLSRLELAALDGDAGGPVFDTGGAVLGMLLPRKSGGRQLPDGVSFAADAGAVGQVLKDAGVRVSVTNGAGAIAPAELTDRANGMTVLVSCWE
ncbi:peptidoglycan-binding protein [Pseudohalocynthiibacter aestuariivivens]|uniref:Serine protease n=1 Tax=Roseovarius pelagicus TaxID=2980108 RepID=A0ABY6D873_9RHOB|nr:MULTISPECIES: serine protease [Rhodobacterales]QIE45739.1 peptidoglycan-binding protein [Pseudohalocynthiibacter aestuariivivens]UXX82334.1 serine protease [Roseovarius pelagicus]